ASTLLSPARSCRPRRSRRSSRPAPVSAGTSGPPAHRPRRRGFVRHLGPGPRVDSLPIPTFVQRLAGAIATEIATGDVSVSVPLRLRPLEIGDLLDETFRMYRRHFLLFAGVSAILAIPSAALYGLGLAWLTVGLQQADSSTDLQLVGGFWIGFLAALLVGLLIL